LYGWSYFQEDRSAYFERRGWFETMEQGAHASAGVIIMGAEKGSRPAARQAYAGALRWAVDLECTAARPDVPDHVAGLSAYEAWAAGLEVDDDYPAGNSEVLSVRLMIHGDQSVMLEERGSAAAFLRQAASSLPEVAGELRTAAGLFDRVKDSMVLIWPWDSWMGEQNQAALAEPGTRHTIARAVREAGKLEAEAVAGIQEALGAMPT
jgi:hypothetical protein